MLGKILRYSPQILEAAQQLYAGYRKTRGATPPSQEPDDVQGRIDALEAAGMEQAELLAKLAEQVRDLSLTLERANRRLRVALAAAVIAMLLALAALVAR